MSNKSPILWIALVVSLFFVQFWLVPTVVKTVTDTEWLRGNPEEGGNASPVSDESTAAAYVQCNRHLQLQQPKTPLLFPNLPERSWDLGFGRYMIAGMGTASADNADTMTHRYLCRIRFLGGGLSDNQNWKLDALEAINP